MENIKKTVGSIKLVALHVRRTDNLLHNSPTVLITDTFRNNAINFLSEKIGSYHILIFSDDKKWCSENLNYKDITQTVVDGLSDIEEMYVMSLCDHFIIGSSSYSWWSAWLSCNKDKIIITPDKWFSGILGRGKPLCEQEKDLIPSEWIRLNISTVEDLKEKNKINIPFLSNITIVTGYFSAKKPNVSQNTYEKWMDNFLTLNEYMIIFTDIQNYEYINSRRNTSNTLIILISIEEFKVAKYMDYWEYCHSIDLEKKHHSKEVYMVWNEKTYFVEKALNLNPFKSDYFFWLDIGCIRDVNVLKSIHKFNVDGIPENKIILSAVTYNIPNNYLNENKISISFENRNGFSCQVFDYIQGGFFGGHKNALSDWIKIYTDELALFVKTNTFGGKDQNIMGNIYLKYQQNFCLTQPKIFDSVNQWFSFLIKMSNLSSYI
jgi:hypothetical protein